MTSSAFTGKPVPWVSRALALAPIEGDYGRTWTKLLPESDYLYADDAEGERAPAGWTRTFPHVLKGAGAAPDEAFYDLWEESPFSDAFLGRLAEASIDALKLGQGRGTDYLAVSFSALDFVGHDFGPRSHEVQDVLARLDRTLASLIAHLDRTVGRDRYVLALTADHGVSPVPEQMAALGLDAGRVVTPDLIARIDRALEPFLGPGKKVGVVGLGGLGHMAVKIASAMGAEVTVITTSPGKVDDARRFGAKTVIVNREGADLSKNQRSLDFILDTVPYQHDLERLFPLLKMDATLCVVGVGKISEPHQIGPFSLLRSRNSFASSQIGGIRETQELVHFCALHGIRPEITKIPTSRIDDAWTKVIDKAARYRFVIDMTNA